MKALEQEQARSVTAPKWRALRTMASFLKMSAWFTLASSVVAAALAIIMGVPMQLLVKAVPLLSIIPATLLSSLSGLIAAIMAIEAGLLALLILFALSEFILLLVTIEHHTRLRS